MKNICVNGDIAIGTCSSHITPIPVYGYVESTQQLVDIQGKPVVINGDMVTFSCGHTGICVASSQILDIMGVKVVLDTDPVVSGGTNPGNVFVNMVSSNTICDTI